MSADYKRLDGRYVFLASNAYSGSTLLSQLMGAHPSIGTISDVSGARREDQMGTFACSCGNLMRQCSFWKEVEYRLERSAASFSLGNFSLGFDDHRPRWMGRLRTRSLSSSLLETARDRFFQALPPNERRMREIGVRNVLFARVILGVTGASIFVDASKERLRARYLSRYVDPELRVIHLVRDVRGVVDSTTRRDKQLLSPAEAARRWAKTNRAITRSIDALPSSRRLMVRHEELCEDTAGTMNRIFRFCGVDPDVDIAELLGRPQHLLGNRMRLGTTSEIRLDERWRDAFGDNELKSIVAAAGETFTMLYPTERDAGPRSGSVTNG